MFTLFKIPSLDDDDATKGSPQTAKLLEQTVREDCRFRVRPSTRAGPGIHIVGQDFILRADFQSASCNIVDTPERPVRNRPAGWNPALHDPFSEEHSHDSTFLSWTACG